HSNDQAIGPDFGEHDLGWREWHDQEMLDRAVLTLADEGRAGEEHGEQGDAIDELDHGHEGGDLEIGIELRPDDQGHRWGGGRCWSAVEGYDLLRDDALDIAGARAGLGHGRGIYVELDCGAPSPHHVGLKVRWDVKNKGVAPGIHGGIDLLDGQ